MVEEGLIIRPENAISVGAAEITYTDDLVKVYFEKNAIFIRVVKELRYRWNPDNIVWYRKITPFNGPAIDRAAELGNKLLAASIPIWIQGDEAREKAINGTYADEQSRWVFASDDKTKYKIWWAGRDEKLYKLARSLPRSRYKNGCVFVPAIYFAEVQDFVQLLGFSISPKASALMEAEREKLESTPVVKVRTKSKNNPVNGLQEILKSEGVLDDLKD